VRSEILTGVLLGVVLGVVAFPLVLVWFGDAVALTVALSSFAAPTVATGVAMLLPWFLDLLELDPAFGSGPMSTVVQDLLTLAIYFTFATAIVLRSPGRSTFSGSGDFRPYPGGPSGP
jgi:magnesium transporter